MARLSVRLGAVRRKRLEEIAAAQGAPISEVVRSLIDDAYEDVQRARRNQAIERLIGLEVEVPQGPAALSQELEAAHDPGGLH